MRRALLTATLALTACLVMWLLAGRAEQGDQPKKKAQPPFVHTVVFYLKKDTPPAKLEAMIADCHKILSKVPSVRGLWAGRPSDKGTPDLAVKDYHLGLTVLFDNYDGLKAYLDDPTHLKFVETYLPLVEKAQVYDFINQAK